MTTAATTHEPHLDGQLTVAGRTLTSRLIVGTGKYPDYPTMAAALDASGAQVVTVAVRRERLIDKEGRSLLDFLDLSRRTPSYPTPPAASPRKTPSASPAWGASCSTNSTTPAKTG